MTDFNELPLADQLRALEAGDELHLRGGGWLPFVEYDFEKVYAIRSTCFLWRLSGLYGPEDCSQDIIRVVRPTERKVPEVVEIMRAATRALAADKGGVDFLMHHRVSVNLHNIKVIKHAFALLADHFEKGEQT